MRVHRGAWRSRLPSPSGSLRRRCPATGTSSWFDDGRAVHRRRGRAATVGVALTAFVGHGPSSEFRFGRLVKAAERIAAGDYTMTRLDPRRRPRGRLGAAINGISTALAETYDRATIDRLTGVANRQALLAALFAEVERAVALRAPAVRRLRRHRPLQGGQRHATGTAPATSSCAASPRRIADNLRASDLIGRYGGEEFMLILTETNVEEGAALTEKLRDLIERLHFAVEGNPDLSVTISIGIVGGSGQQLRSSSLVRDADAAMYSAKSLGRNQTYIFEEPDEDARVPRAPISDAGPRARDRDRPAGPRRRDGRAHLGHRAAPPLPRPAVGAHRRRSSSRWRASSSCPTPRSTGSGSQRCSTTSARSPSPRRSSTSPRR